MDHSCCVCVCVRVYCLTNLICSLFSLSLFSSSSSSLSSYYFSITFPIRLIAQGCVFFFLCSPVRVFLSGEPCLKFERKKRQENTRKNSRCFQFFFSLRTFFYLCFLFFSFFFFAYMIIYSLCFILVWYTSRLIKQNR